MRALVRIAFRCLYCCRRPNNFTCLLGVSASGDFESNDSVKYFNNKCYFAHSFDCNVLLKWQVILEQERNNFNDVAPCLVRNILVFIYFLCQILCTLF